MFNRLPLENDVDYLRRLGDWPAENLTERELQILGNKIEALAAIVVATQPVVPVQPQPQAPITPQVLGPRILGMRWLIFGTFVVSLLVVTIVISVRAAGQVEGILIGVFGLLLAGVTAYLPNYVQVVPTTGWLHVVPKA